MKFPPPETNFKQTNKKTTTAITKANGVGGGGGDNSNDSDDSRIDAFSVRLQAIYKNIRLKMHDLIEFGDKLMR